MQMVKEEGLWMSTRPLEMSKRAWEKTFVRPKCHGYRAASQGTHLMPFLPLVEFLRRGQHLEDVVSELVIGDQDTTRASMYGCIQPVPVVIGAVWCCVQLICDAKPRCECQMQVACRKVSHARDISHWRMM